MVCSNIKRQTHRFAKSPFVIFENLRARQMYHHFLIRGSGCASFAHFTLRCGSNPACVSHQRHINFRASQPQLS